MKKLINAYTAPERKYHNLEHITKMLTTWGLWKQVYAEHAQIKEIMKTPNLEDVLIHNIWYHDYVITYGENDEMHSAKAALSDLIKTNSIAVDDTVAMNTILPILATKHKGEKVLFNSCVLAMSSVLCDLDIVGMVGGYLDFHNKSCNIVDEILAIRGEMTRSAVWQARKNWIKVFLKRDVIFLLPFNQRLTQSVRDNLTQELNSIQI
jgi:predicted metal-dependent HD superfamily phosphohydrolase